MPPSMAIVSRANNWSFLRLLSAIAGLVSREEFDFQFLSDFLKLHIGRQQRRSKFDRQAGSKAILASQSMECFQFARSRCSSAIRGVNGQRQFLHPLRRFGGFPLSPLIAPTLSLC